MKLKRVVPYIPGVGLVAHTASEIKKRRGKKPVYNLKDKNDRKALGKFAIQTGYLAIGLFYKLVIGVYIKNGLSMGEWNPFKQKKEQVQEILEEKQGKLEEKTIDYSKIPTEKFTAK